MCRCQNAGENNNIKKADEVVGDVTKFKQKYMKTVATK